MSISEVFEDGKIINVEENEERADGDENFLKDKDWYAFNSNFGTSEEITKKALERFAEFIKESKL